MPLAAHVGSAVVTGHGCDAATVIAGPGAPTVLINGIPAVTQIDGSGRLQTVYKDRNENVICG